VQTGFVVSNHAIRRNRKIAIDALITNTPVVGVQGSHHWQSLDNSSAGFAILQHLVNNAVLCNVVTNIGIYTNVIFDRFATQQGEGMIDAMRFVLSGQEIQVKNSFTKTAPSPAIFTVVRDTYKGAALQALHRAGLTGVTLEDTISQAVVSGSFGVKVTDGLGNESMMTYEQEARDAVSNAFIYSTKFTGGKLFRNSLSQPQFNFFSLNGIPGDGELSGDELRNAARGALEGTMSCVEVGLTNLTYYIGDKLIETAVGWAKDSIYGAFGKDVTVPGGALGQILWNIGTECLITGGKQFGAGIVQAILTPAEIKAAKEATLPTTKDLIAAADKLGEDRAAGKVTMPNNKMVVTKITKASAGILVGFL
jgi:hypothetical protein